MYLGLKDTWSLFGTLLTKPKTFISDFYSSFVTHKIVTMNLLNLSITFGELGVFYVFRTKMKQKLKMHQKSKKKIVTLIH